MHFSTSVRTGRKYGPYVRAVGTGSAYRPLVRGKEWDSLGEESEKGGGLAPPQKKMNFSLDMAHFREF